MRFAVSMLYVAALVMQVAGVYFVIHDAAKSRANVRLFTETWDQLDGPHNPRNWPENKQAAIAKWVRSEYAMSDFRRFAPVGVLLLGVLVGFVGNIMALHIST